MQLVIEPGGSVRCIYSEEMDLTALGTVVITRASRVEPAFDGGWYADLGPVGGPSLGRFAKRSEALAAEIQWLEHHWLRPS